MDNITSWRIDLYGRNELELRFAVWTFAVCSVVHLVAERLCAKSGAFLGTVRTPKGVGQTSQTQYVAYIIVSGVAVSALTAMGWVGLFVLPQGGSAQPLAFSNVTSSFEGRVTTPVAFGDELGEFMTGYQVYNLLVCLLLNDLRTVPKILHHSLTALVSSFTRIRLCQMYMLYFMGIAETSTIPLLLVELDKRIPKVTSRFPNIMLAAKICFAASFILVRVLAWMPLLWMFLKDCALILNYMRERGLSTIPVHISLGCTATLTMLQLYWAYLVVLKSRRMVRQDKKHA
jgi:hypothetical protein